MKKTFTTILVLIIILANLVLMSSCAAKCEKCEDFDFDWKSNGKVVWCTKCNNGYTMKKFIELAFEDHDEYDRIYNIVVAKETESDSLYRMQRLMGVYFGNYNYTDD